MSIRDERATMDLLAEGRALAPWHLLVGVTEEISTRDFADAPYPESHGHIRLLDPGPRFVATLKRLFPQGLAGRTVLDCACNNGAYLFWAKEHGAGRCHGIDVREHWIKQARFLSANRTLPSDDVEFQELDLYDLPAQSLDQFDLVLFNGIFYHLPDPIAGLKVAADLARDVLIVNTSTTIDLPDGELVGSGESLSRGVSGVYGLNWFPTGPEVLKRILGWVGFPHVRTNWWQRLPDQAAHHARLEIVAARDQSTLEGFDRAEEKLRPLPRMVEIAVPPDATVLVAGAPHGTAIEFDGRAAVSFPVDPERAVDDSSLITELVMRRGEGAGFLLFPGDVVATWLPAYPEFGRHVFKTYRRIVREEGVGVLFSLLPAWRPK